MNRTLLLVLISLCGGCANVVHRHDPLEPLNRAVFAFNEKADQWVLQPVAKGYKEVTPSVVRSGVSNFFGNISDIFSGVNNLLQGKTAEAGDSFGRALLNTSLGMAGLFDIASEAGIERTDEDLGQTLGVWGAGSGPYLVLPLLGPSSVRDTVGSVVQGLADPVNQLNSSARIGTQALRAVNTRAELLGTEKILEQAALDKYVFVRRAYLQRRRNLIYDGNPPPEEED